jgi:hypothetical protein
MGFRPFSVQAGFCAEALKREDAYFLQGPSQPQNLFGVWDGHNGAHAAQFCATFMPAEFERQCGGSATPDPHAVLRALTATFLRAEAAFLDLSTNKESSSGAHLGLPLHLHRVEASSLVAPLHPLPHPLFVEQALVPPLHSCMATCSLLLGWETAALSWTPGLRWCSCPRTIG